MRAADGGQWVGFDLGAACDRIWLVGARSLLSVFANCARKASVLRSGEGAGPSAVLFRSRGLIEVSGGRAC